MLSRRQRTATHFIKRGILVLGIEQLDLLSVGQPMGLVELLLGLGELALERSGVDGRELRITKYQVNLGLVQGQGKGAD